MPLVVVRVPPRAEEHLRGYEDPDDEHGRATKPCAVAYRRSCWATSLVKQGGKGHALAHADAAPVAPTYQEVDYHDGEHREARGGGGEDHVVHVAVAEWKHLFQDGCPAVLAPFYGEVDGRTQHGDAHEHR